MDLLVIVLDITVQIMAGVLVVVVQGQDEVRSGQPSFGGAIVNTVPQMWMNPITTWS